jgi:hypothetical protein
MKQPEARNQPAPFLGLDEFVINVALIEQVPEALDGREQRVGLGLGMVLAVGI